MKVVKKFEVPVSTFGQSKHDWDGIFSAKVAREALGKSGEAVELVEGTDFEAGEKGRGAQAFAGFARNQGAKRHLNVKSTIVKKEGQPAKIYVQVCDMTDAEAAEADAKFEANKEKGKQRRLEKEAAKNGALAVAGSTTPQSQAS